VLQQELKGRKRLIADNEDFVAFAPFASRFPFEMCVLPKFHSSAFSRIEASQGKNLALILRDVLQKLDQKVGGPPYNLSLHDRPFLRPRGNYWKTIEEDFHWHIEILPKYLVLLDLSGLRVSSITRCRRKSPPAASHRIFRQNSPVRTLPDLDLLGGRSSGLSKRPTTC
jgi:galactose-1-phosphate uridylyltransferase